MKVINNGKAHIQKIHEAAMQQPLNKVSELVVDTAIELVRTDNGRLRFVDYTGKKLVPGAIRGALEEKPELAVRKFGECIVGQVAVEKVPIKENVVQDNPYFKTFKEKVRNRGKNDINWKKYHDETLEHIGSEIAVPVLAGNTLLGVLNVNTPRKDAFEDSDKHLLCTFASEIAVAFLQRSTTILEEIFKIQEEMISVFELEEVAQHIADGIRKMVEGSIPNIFLFDENCEEKNTSPFQFLASAGASEEERALGAFEPRKEGRGMEAIKNFKKGEDAFVVVEDVQKKDKKGSPNAREKGIKTTGCLPLVFRGMVVGVLYLHFFKERHFFTIEEKNILQMFAISAAIAIKNATMLQTYVELFGNGLIKQLEEFESKDIR